MASRIPNIVFSVYMRNAFYSPNAEIENRKVSCHEHKEGTQQKFLRLHSRTECRELRYFIDFKARRSCVMASAIFFLYR